MSLSWFLSTVAYDGKEEAENTRALVDNTVNEDRLLITGVKVTLSDGAEDSLNEITPVEVDWPLPAPWRYEGELTIVIERQQSVFTVTALLFTDSSEVPNPSTVST
jgi:hypothetical protein